jgi:hypothetical protein
VLAGWLVVNELDQTHGKNDDPDDGENEEHPVQGAELVVGGDAQNPAQSNGFVRALSRKEVN